MRLLIALCALLAAACAQALPRLEELAGQPQLVRSCWPSAPRTKHGFPGITPQQCADGGSCFSDSDPAQPWCYFPNEPTNWSAPGPVARYAGSQAAPAVASLLGAAHAAESGDVAGMTCWSVPPLAQECDSLAAAPSAAALGWPFNLTVSGSAPRANLTFQWTAAELRRWAAVGSGAPGGGGGCAVATALRLSAQQPPLALLRVTVSGCAPGAPLALAMALPALVSSEPGTWSWGRPAPPSDPARFAAALRNASSGTVAVSQDTASAAAAASGAWAPGAASLAWRLAPLAGGAVAALEATWPPGAASAELGLVLALASGEGAGDAAAAAADAAAAAFPSAFAAAGSAWEALWAAAFTPGSGVFSGALPALPWPPAPPPAPPSLSPAYYGGVLSLLQLLRNTSAGAWALPTAAPVWAVTDTYLWDASLAGSVMALLEPVGWLRDTLAPALAVNFHEHYARDYLSGAGVGPWYAFNDVSVFTLLDKYGGAGEVARAAVEAAARPPRDASAPAPTPSPAPAPAPINVAFFNSTLAGRRVVEWMDQAATYWQALVAPGSSLADYGTAANLLECVPTYLHRVPALNAANVGMMARAGAIWRALGNASRAEALEAAAAALLPHVLALYAGDGTFQCEYPGGARVGVRTVIDFAYVAGAIPGSLNASVRSAMLQFARGELVVPGWLRALSLRDAAAGASDRADHGPLGAYDGWPPAAALAFAALGSAGEARALLAGAAGSALREGCFGQAHRVLNELTAAGAPGAVIKQGLAGGQDFFEFVGGAFAEAALLLLPM